jgi:type I restriction enzyme S subunit
MNLPDGWKSVKLDEIAKYYDGTHQTPEYIESGIPFISVENIYNLKGSKKYISTADFDKYNIKPQKNDLFMTRIGEIGLVNIVEDDEPLAYYVTLALIRPMEIFPRFLLYYINNNIFQRELNKRALLNAVPPKINLGDIGKISISAPPLPEQHAIAEILTTADKVIAVKERLITAKKKQKQWLMQNLLTGKIRLSGFSGEWEKRKLGEIADKCTAKNRDFAHSLVLTNSAQRGIIPQGEHFDKDIAVDENIDGYFIVNDGEFVYNPRISITAPCGPIRRNNLGETGVMSPLYTVFKLKNNMINTTYIEYYFLSSAWYHYIESIANYGARHDRMSITDDNFFAMPILLPPLPEQHAIAAVLSTTDHEIELLKKELEQQKLTKKYLMQKLLTGKIRVKGAIA